MTLRPMARHAVVGVLPPRDDVDTRHGPLERERCQVGPCKLAHAFLWEYNDKKLKFAQLLGQLSLFLTWPSMTTPFFAEAQNGRDSASDRKPVVSTYRVNTWPSGSMPHVSGVPVHEITHNAMVLALRRLADHRLRVAPARDHLRTRFRQSSLWRLTNTGH
jgi:hypothetical protein